MPEDTTSGGLFGGLMKQAKAMVDQTQPHCELCGGTLVGGCLTVSTERGPIILCLKCVFKGISYYLVERTKALEQSK